MEKQTIRKVLNRIALFVKDIGLLTYKVIKQVNLPNRRRKGNILSSLLLLFISLSDLLINFSWGFSIGFITRWKHYDFCRSLIRKSVLIAGCSLFFLSSFEWSYKASPQLTGTIPVSRVENRAYKESSELTIVFHPISFINPGAKGSDLIYSENLYAPLEIHSHLSKLYLQNCNLRI